MGKVNYLKRLVLCFHQECSLSTCPQLTAQLRDKHILLLKDNRKYLSLYMENQKRSHSTRFASYFRQACGLNT